MKHLLVFILLMPYVAFSQRTDRKLEKKIRAAIDTFHGNVGVYIHDLKKNRIVAINADSVFPTASIVKVPIMVGVMEKMHRGELGYHQELVYNDSLLYAGVDILGSFKNGEKIELSKVLMLMLTMSDNTASLWLQSLAGTGTRINDIMDSHGFKHTRVNSRTAGREEMRDIYGWGQTTPREMAGLLKRMVDGSLISDSMSSRMLQLLGRNYWDAEGLSQIPAGVFVASKNGAVNASRSEVMFVNGAGRRYIFGIFTSNNKDVSWNQSNEAWKMTREVSRIIWEHLD